jgi:hypothetical protein
LILPYLEEKDVYDSFDLNAPWDSPRNRELLARRPYVYRPMVVNTQRTHTFDQVFIGAGAAFDGPEGIAVDDFPDGLDKTLLVVEAAEPVPWSQPIDLPYMAVAQLPPLGGDFKANSRPFDARGVDGYHILFGDGSVRFINKKNISEHVLRALITRNGKEPLNDSEF